MTLRTWTTLAAALAAAFTLAACGSSSSDAPPGPGDVFGDAINPGIDYQPFGGSDMTAHSIDAAEKHAGAASFRVLVPATGYVGGAFVSATARDLSAFNAVTFWVKGSKAATLNVAGFAVDNTPSTPFKVERGGIAVGTSWAKVILPLPAPARLTAEKGLFHFAEGSDEGAYTLWIDDIRYELLPAADIGTPAPAIATETRSLEVGASLTVAGASVVYPTPGAGAILSVANRYFTWASSSAAATVSQDGVVTGVSAGAAAITAKLGAVDAAGTTTVNVSLPQAPAAAAPAPTAAPADVISLFSNAYTNVAVDTWRTGWSAATLTELQVAGDDVKKYSDLGFVGVEAVAAPIDATAMTHFHVDAWSPTAGDFKIKLVDFGAGGAFGGGDDVEHEVTVALTASGWNQLDLPLTDFTNLTTRAHVAQLIFSGANPTVFVDNVYFHK